MRLTNRQRVKVNAALSMIHAEGYDAQALHGWAAEYRREGYPPAKAFERALNEFIAGQPELAPAITKITRLIHASDDQTVALYDGALNEFIATGDDTALAALGPMIARDSVNLAVQNGELSGATFTPESLEAALGFVPGDTLVASAVQAQAATPTQSQAKEETAVKTDNGVTLDSGQVTSNRSRSPFGPGGLSTKQEQFAQTFNTGSPGEARGILAGHVVGPNHSLSDS